MGVSFSPLLCSWCCGNGQSRSRLPLPLMLPTSQCFQKSSRIARGSNWMDRMQRHLSTTSPDFYPAAFRLSAGILWVLQAQSAAPVPTSRGRTQRSAAALAVCLRALCVSWRWWHLPAVYRQNWLQPVPISAAPWAPSLDPSQPRPFLIRSTN